MVKFAAIVTSGEARLGKKIQQIRTPNASFKCPWVEKHAVNKSLLDTFTGIKRTVGNSF